MTAKHRTMRARPLALLLALTLVAFGAAGCLPTPTPTLPAATVVLGPQPVTPVIVTPLPPSPTLVATATEAPPTPTAVPPTPAGDTLTLTILHTNDISGWTEPCG